MRWKAKSQFPPPPTLREGDVRVVTKFLLFPKQLKKEWRWLEWAKIRETCAKRNVGQYNDYPDWRYYWSEQRWEDSK